jgi:hypothetical protein
MLTVYVHVEVSTVDEARALQVGRDHGYEGRRDGDYPPRIGGVVLEYAITYPEADSNGPEQREAGERLHAALTAAGIEFDARGGGIGIGSGSSSTFAIYGPGDEAPRLPIPAMGRARFEELLRMVDHDLYILTTPGFRITVRGLAALDADTQEAPFEPLRD